MTFEDNNSILISIFTNSWLQLFCLNGNNWLHFLQFHKMIYFEMFPLTWQFVFGCNFVSSLSVARNIAGIRSPVRTRRIFWLDYFRSERFVSCQWVRIVSGVWWWATSTIKPVRVSPNGGTILFYIINRSNHHPVHANSITYNSIYAFMEEQ